MVMRAERLLEGTQAQLHSKLGLHAKH